MTGHIDVDATPGGWFRFLGLHAGGAARIQDELRACWSALHRYSPDSRKLPALAERNLQLLRCAPLKLPESGRYFFHEAGHLFLNLHMGFQTDVEIEDHFGKPETLNLLQRFDHAA